MLESEFFVTNPSIWGESAFSIDRFLFVLNIPVAWFWGRTRLWTWPCKTQATPVFRCLKISKYYDKCGKKKQIKIMSLRCANEISHTIGVTVLHLLSLKCYYHDKLRNLSSILLRSKHCQWKMKSSKLSVTHKSYIRLWDIGVQGTI